MMTAILPDASNHAHWVKTGIVPKIALDMMGDTEFEILIKNPLGASLDEERSRVKVKLVTMQEMNKLQDQSKSHALELAYR